MNKWQLEHPEELKLYNRKYHLKRTYNLTLEAYSEIFDNQKGCCKLCGKHHNNVKRGLFIDHCHTTGKVRGLLCYKCNTNIGLYENYKNDFEKYIKENI